MTVLLLTLVVHAQRPLASISDRIDRRPLRSEGGQATAEYALVLLGVAAIALLLAAWAAKSGKVGQLFDSVVDELIDKVR